MSFNIESQITWNWWRKQMFSLTKSLQSKVGTIVSSHFQVRSSVNINSRRTRVFILWKLQQCLKVLKFLGEVVTLVKVLDNVRSNTKHLETLEKVPEKPDVFKISFEKHADLEHGYKCRTLFQNQPRKFACTYKPQF